MTVRYIVLCQLWETYGDPSTSLEGYSVHRSRTDVAEVVNKCRALGAAGVWYRPRGLPYHCTVSQDELVAIGRLPPGDLLLWRGTNPPRLDEDPLILDAEIPPRLLVAHKIH